ncbi:LOW QUALITY PROTEIN: uncharacterized protein [Drosophila bipectinata]|uniref:LOW QUALITY PROTEIN: uncharacterized protein n=1 Tax=Drosophila bipectinata TaxID=42026 RepID=UPI0038B2E5AC
MSAKISVWIPLLLLVVFYPNTSLAIWFPWYFHRYGLQPHSMRHGTQGATCPPGYEPKSNPVRQIDAPSGSRAKSGVTNAPPRLCDDNPILMQLARLYVVSPERIVLLLSQTSLTDSWLAEIHDVLENIKNSMRLCVLAPDNIYGNLANGLSYFRKEVCDGGEGSNRKRSTGLQQAHTCFKELRTDMIECEAPADWYERRNKTKVCQIFNDVLDCYYTRAALLCGIDSAKELRSFAGDCMSRSMIHKCDVSSRLPRVDNAMPSPNGNDKSLKPFWDARIFIFACYAIYFFDY